ncbi:MAG: tRNA (guanosine(46)-N7)-methyltransferase TrmB [Planctomycetes bacterium RBG_13_44_8b]|nr:MAG: tRNA (guanosine(46)-N7)-methyltransferase TrmB [Planctomycetes bacterium RBG_13_44_8b]
MAKKQPKEYPHIALRPEEVNGKIDFSDIFGRKTAVHPVRDGKSEISGGQRQKPVSNGVHIEIGTGKGTFLVSQAQAFPGINFLGIEWANKYYKYAIDRIGRRAIGNVRIIRTEAALFLSKHIRGRSVDCFHIYFPDPWPKRAHHKRRFVCAENITQMIRCLKKNGLINVATDHAGYFQWMKDEFESFAKKLKPAQFVKPAGVSDNEIVGTNYERKYIKEKRAIYTLAFRKI